MRLLYHRASAASTDCSASCTNPVCHNRVSPANLAYYRTKLWIREGCRVRCFETPTTIPSLLTLTPDPCSYLEARASDPRVRWPARTYRVAHQNLVTP